MLKWATAGSAMVLLGALAMGPAMSQTSTSPSTGSGAMMKMSQAECQATWSQLDSSKSGSVSQAQATTHVKDFSAADTNKDGKLSSAEFLSACDKGMVQGSATTGSGAGTGGSTTAPKK